MARLSEMGLICDKCGNEQEVPYCCGRQMERDNHVFFCPICHKELEYPVCCGTEMTMQKKVLDIKKEIFGSL
jgi:transcription initiation factor IIE alpha subunit